MAINVEVEKNNQESTANLIRRFTKRMQSSGIVTKVRRGRYHKRSRSAYVVKSDKLKKLERTARYEKMLKLGKIQEQQHRGR